VHHDGTSFSGSWVDDKQHGRGKEQWEKGYYEGDFVMGKKQGEGVMQMDDGSLYRGQFEKDQFEGYGQYISPDGTKYIGNWE